MPFTVTLPGGTKDHEFEEYAWLLRSWRLNVVESPRNSEPGTGNRWLHVWEHRADAQRFAEELKAVTVNPGWVVYELYPLICPNCHIGLEERQLVTTTWTVGPCPNCRAPVRRSERWGPARTAALRSGAPRAGKTATQSHGKTCSPLRSGWAAWREKPAPVGALSGPRP